MTTSLRSALEEVRRISQRLRPGMLEDLGLLSSLASLAGELTETSGIPVTKGFGPGLPQLGADTELVVYRVAQEALTNVARHAQASSVELGLSRRGSTLVLRVADDGVGLGRGGHGEGAGIQGMRERALLVGGSLRIGRGEGGEPGPVHGHVGEFLGDEVAGKGGDEQDDDDTGQQGQYGGHRCASPWAVVVT